jgi:hypothetical protein
VCVCVCVCVCAVDVWSEFGKAVYVIPQRGEYGVQANACSAVEDVREG